MKVLTQILLVFTLLTAGLFTQELQAQKKKNKEEGISKYERANAEYLFIEAQKFFLLEDYERAQAFLKQSLEIDANNHAAHFKIAEIHLVTEKYDQGLAAIDEAIKLSADNKYYYILAAQLHKAKNNLLEAVKQYELMVANTTDYKEYLLDMVDIYVELADYDKALSTLELTEQQFKSPDKFMLQKKELLVEAGRTSEAIDYLKRLLAQKPDNAELLTEYSALLTLAGRESEAINYLETEAGEIAIAKPLLFTHYLRAGLFEKASPLLSEIQEEAVLPLTGQISLATDLMALDNAQSLPLLQNLVNGILDKAPDNNEALALQSQLLTRMSAANPDSQGKHFESQAIEVLMRLKESDPSNFDNWKRILDHQYNQENWQALLEESEASLDYFPNQGLFYFYLASANLYTTQLDEVEDLLDQALRLGSRNDSLKSRIYAKKGELAFGQGENDLAATHFSEALSTLRLTEVINNYSFRLALHKIDLEQALRLANELTAADNDRLKHIRTKAFVLFQSAAYAQARQVMEEGLQRLEPQIDGPARELYGDILIKLDMIDEAVEQWQKAKSLGNTSGKLDQKIANKEYFE